MAQVLAFDKQQQVQALHNLEAEQSLLGALMLNNQVKKIKSHKNYYWSEHFKKLNKILFQQNQDI